MYVAYDKFPPVGDANSQTNGSDGVIDHAGLMDHLAEKFSIDLDALLGPLTPSESMLETLAALSKEQVAKYRKFVGKINKAIDNLPDGLKEQFKPEVLKGDLIKLTLGSAAAFLTTLSLAGGPTIIVAILLHKAYNGTKDTEFRVWLKEKFKNKLGDVRKSLENAGVDVGEETTDFFATAASNFVKYLEEVLTGE